MCYDDDHLEDLPRHGGRPDAYIVFSHTRHLLSRRVPHFPEEDSKLRATAVQVRRGGNCPNTLEVLQQLLLSGSANDSEPDSRQQRPRVVQHLVACLPNARAAATGKILSSFGPGSPIDFSHCIYRDHHDEAASSYIIRSAETGSRTIVNFQDLPEMTVGEFENIADKFTEHAADCWWHFEVRHA